MNLAQLKQQILSNCKHHKVQVTAQREQVLDLILAEHGVIKAYDVLSKLQAASSTAVAPPTAYRALDFWVEQGVLHKVAAVNGYVLCSHAQHDCGAHCHENAPHHSAFILVCSECGAVDEQTLSCEWQALRAGVAAGGFSLQDEHVVLTGICSKCQ